MTKCYGEECEYNGQPECHLPDGVPCPHGVTADKPAAESGTDIEKLIRKGKSFSRKRESIEDELIQDLTTALSTLHAENEELRADVVGFNDLLASYQNVLVPELRSELEKVKRECDEAVQYIRGIAKSGRVWMCPYCVHAKDTTGSIAECELDVGVCMMPYSKFEWRGQKED